MPRCDPDQLSKVFRIWPADRFSGQMKLRILTLNDPGVPPEAPKLKRMEGINKLIRHSPEARELAVRIVFEYQAKHSSP